MEVPKLFHALLTGVLRRTFEDNEEMTVEFFMENIFAGTDATSEGVAALTKRCELILKKAASLDWDPSKLEAALSETDMSETQREVFVHFWKNNKAKIHDIVCQKSNWNKRLSSVEWRLDMKVSSRSAPEINEPTAIVQLNFQKKEDESSVQFEMNKKQLQMAMNQINSIQEQIDLLSK
mmetsp:Transcript_41632/g.58071  ORF Transcript_41632/g.58071 Transcript_41632/m.58071 type:complete len:179 (+) Transcript_41632:505-1041(+)